MKKYNLFVCFLICLILFSCNSKPKYYGEYGFGKTAIKKIKNDLIANNPKFYMFKDYPDDKLLAMVGIDIRVYIDKDGIYIYQKEGKFDNGDMMVFTNDQYSFDKSKRTIILQKDDIKIPFFVFNSDYTLLSMVDDDTMLDRIPNGDGKWRFKDGKK